MSLCLETYFAHKVGYVEDGHDQDGQPFPQCDIPDLRLQSREKTQRDEVSDGNRQHVSPDHPGNYITMQDHVCNRRGHCSITQ